MGANSWADDNCFCVPISALEVGTFFVGATCSRHGGRMPPLQLMGKAFRRGRW